METGLDLAIRETLLAVIAEQQGVVTGQQGAIAELRQRVESLVSPAVRRRAGRQDAGA